MTSTLEQGLREAVSAEKLTYPEVWSTVTATSRDLARAIAAGDLEECERAAKYIGDICAYLNGRR